MKVKAGDVEYLCQAKLAEHPGGLPMPPEFVVPVKLKSGGYSYFLLNLEASSMTFLHDEEFDTIEDAVRDGTSDCEELAQTCSSLRGGSGCLDSQSVLSG